MAGKLTWVRRGVGYYQAVGYSGIGVCIRQVDVACWHVYAGDNTAARACAPTLREAKVVAERLFG